MRLVRCLVVGALLWLAVGVPASADQMTHSSMSNAMLVSRCNETDLMQLDCAGYIMGVFDAMSISGSICPPADERSGTLALVTIGFRYVNGHPEEWHWPTVYLLTQAFKAAYPCPPNHIDGESVR